MQQLNGTERDGERHPATFGDSQTCSKSMGPGETVKEREQQSETVRDSQQLYGTGRDSGRHPATIGDRERHAVTPWH